MDLTFIELRKQHHAKNEVLSHVNARIQKHQDRLSSLLLNERESDMLRGRIAELKKLLALVQDTGEADE